MRGNAPRGSIEQMQQDLDTQAAGLCEVVGQKDETRKRRGSDTERLSAG